ncbi:YbaB/EbfC family nucleoid-associated protein [Micromonospora sp. AP08]|uniref:YbaB/EbfC family nucleoid-associated protein n=1 Tax=Micromonospora sp. AP08 TaxID=2604467 RepID=UPI0011D39D6E|nr:YbaB/EbfC family nucleoid-associated protein [Micromonospora sp. AP08]TYB40422.1 YbaB/EbfC family nucleoid-associated protein [Micromonospora sp. AP08]
MDADAAEDWVSSWAASVSERAAQTQEMSRRVADLTASAAGADGAVRVTVAASGVVTELRLDERVRNWPAARISAEIMATMRRAQARLAGAVADVAAQTVGVDSETGRAVVASYASRFPEPPEESDDGPSSRRRGVW